MSGRMILRDSNQLIKHTLRPLADQALGMMLGVEWNKIDHLWGFPGGAGVKNPPANAEDTGSIPGLGRFHVPQSN